MDRFDRVLHDVFGFTGFRPFQETIITNVLEGKNTLAILPTGFGKSLTYQVPAYLLNGLTVIFSPLIALMKDQVDKLNNIYKIPSVALHSYFLKEDEEGYCKAITDIKDGRVKIVFIAPEKLDNEDVMNAIESQIISLIVIDEAHCVSEWGHDFRPYYRQIIKFVHKHSNSRVLALTATAPPMVEKDIISQLSGKSDIIRASSYRDNLELHLIKVSGDIEKYTALSNIVPRLEGTGIIYVGTREEAARVSAFMKYIGISSNYYHGGLEDMRTEIQDGFMSDEWKVTAATNALGMGIDKANIRFIIHFRFPSSLELYYQEIGRAGRDGFLSKCILLYDMDDIKLQRYFIDQARPSKEKYDYVLGAMEGKRIVDIELITGMSNTEVKNILMNLQDMGIVEKRKDRYCRISDRAPDFSFYDAIRQQRIDTLNKMLEYSNYQGCLMNFICRYLGDTNEIRCGMCTNCRNIRYERYLADKTMATEFSESWIPIIEPGGAHRGGFALAIYGGSKIGETVSLYKYDKKMPYPSWIVEKAVDIIKNRYGDIDIIIAIPSTLSGNIVEAFAMEVAGLIGILYSEILKKQRTTLPQKAMQNRVQKRRNVKDSFTLTQADYAIENKNVLIIDDIYDSGWTLREASKTINKAKPANIFVFTITRTRHSDDI